MRYITYISMDLTQQALLTNGKFLQILESFFELVTFFSFFQIIVALGLCKQGGGGICAEHAF